MLMEPLEAKPLRFRPGRMQVRLLPEHRRAYAMLYAGYQSVLAGLPVLRQRDFERGTASVTRAELDALNSALTGVRESRPAHPGTPFGPQEATRRGLFKRLQYLS